MAEGTNTVMAKGPNIRKEQNRNLEDSEKESVFLGYWVYFLQAEASRETAEVWLAVCQLHRWSALYSEPPPPHCAPRPSVKSRSGRECSCLPNHKHPTASSQRMHADPGSDLSTCWHLCCPSWKLSFSLLTHVMAAAAGTTFSVAVQIRTGRADQEENRKSFALWTSASSFIKWERGLCLRGC